MLLILILFAFGVLDEIGLSHDIHMSKSEIIFNPETSTVQVATNIFLDDLEEALSLRGNEKLHLFTEREDSLANEYISNYLFDNIGIVISEEPIDFIFIGKEISEDLTSIWCYFESDVIDINQEAIISNTVLLKLFEDQRNITVLKKGNERGKHYILDTDDNSIVKDAYH